MIKLDHIVGWDVGGAHLKAVLINEHAVALQAIQVACPLWLGLAELEIALNQVLQQLPNQRFKHAITMTGELVDAFANRYDGVIQITKCMQQTLGDDSFFYAGESNFVRFDQVASLSNDIASANWQASATFLAGAVDKGLFIDIGSTTTDFILLAENKSLLNGFNDATRLQTSELVYTGAYRTPVMAIATQVPFAGYWVHVAAEHFATMADVYRITGDCHDLEEMSNTADGKGKSLGESMTRLARMVGRDRADAEYEAWFGLAVYLKHAQIALLKQATFRHLSRLPAQTDFCFIGAGAGAFLVQTLAQQLGFKYQPITELIPTNNQKTLDGAGLCFPAFAVAAIQSKHA